MDLAFIRKLLQFCSKCNCPVQCLQSALRYRISMHIPRTDPYPIYSEFCEYDYINHKLYPRHNFWTDPYILKFCENGSGYESRLTTFTTSVAEKQTWLCNWAGSLHWIFEVSKMLGFQIYCRKSPICRKLWNPGYKSQLPRHRDMSHGTPENRNRATASTSAGR